MGADLALLNRRPALSSPARGPQPRDANTKALRRPHAHAAAAALERRSKALRGLLVAFHLDSLELMRRPIRSKVQRPQGAFLLAPGSGFRHYRSVVLAVSAVLVVSVVMLIHALEPTAHPLPPVGAVVVAISAVAAALAGVWVGLISALAGVLFAFLFLADFSTRIGTANALISASLWVGAAVGTGIIGRHLRGQVAQRESALENELSRSLTAQDTLGHVFDISSHLLQGKTLSEVARTACETALETFSVDSARVFRLNGTTMELLAFSPRSERIRPGYSLQAKDFPDLEVMLAQRTPLFVRDVGDTRPTGSADKIRKELGIVSTVRLPIIGPTGPSGVLSLGWTRPVDRPDDTLLTVMQRFADQVAIAWHNALRLEAQRRADSLHRTLERVVKLAPTFHISGTREAVAKAICNAALATFQCSGAALYRVEGDRLQLLERRPYLESLTPGRAFPMSDDMPLAREIHSPKATFIADVSAPTRSLRPWPLEVVTQAGTRSALYVPLRFHERGPANLLVLTWRKSRKAPDDSFLVIVQRFADQAALALAHSSAERLHATLEANLLPTAPVNHPLLEVLTRYRTGEQRLRLGGDFVGSTVSAEGLLSFVIGDVSGHGPDAAALGANLRSTWKALTLVGQSLTSIAKVMTNIVQAEGSAPNIFATVLLGRIDVQRGLLTWVNAGHMPPLLIAGGVQTLDSRPTPPLGVGKNTKRSPHRAQLPERWSLFCYTDGLIDARLAPGSRQRYGEDRLIERLGAWGPKTPSGAAVDELLAEIETGSGSRFADDVAVLLISTKPAVC
jgi:serine phosphatase RsbU (regulator of sigma subunit)